MSDAQDAYAPTNPSDWFRANMQRIRNQRGWSQGLVARWMVAAGFEDWHQATVSRIEKGTRPVRLEEALALAGVFETTLDNMLRPSGDAELVEDLALWLKAAQEAEQQFQSSGEKYLSARHHLEESSEDVRAKLAGEDIDTATARDLTTMLQLADVVTARTMQDVVDKLVAWQRERADAVAKARESIQRQRRERSGES